MERLVIVALVLGLSECGYIPEQQGLPVFRPDYTFYDEAKVYLKFQEIPATFEEAHLRCRLEGASLASPINDRLETALRTLMDSTKLSKGIMTGIHATFSKGDFVSVEGVPLSQIPHQWAANEPNNLHNKESCINLDVDGFMSDVNCEEPLTYVCYKKEGDYKLNECGTIDNEYRLDNRTGECYKFHTRARTWPRAYMTCAAEGGHLAIINSETEATVITEIFKMYHDKLEQADFSDHALIGFLDSSKRGEWLTIKGDSIKDAGFDTWAKGEPNNINNIEFCGSVGYRGGLNDVPCDSRYGYICEKDTKMSLKL